MQFFQAPPATRYDLNFTLFGFPIRIHPLFWLIALLLSSGSRNLLYIFVFFIVIILSLIVHELGHAFALRSMGQESQIVLYHGGGLTIPEERAWGYNTARVALSPAQDILVAVAGAGTGFLLVLMLSVLLHFFGASITVSYMLSIIPIPQLSLPLGSSILTAFFTAFVSVNMFWGVISLLPVVPMDGSTVMRHILQHFDRADGYRKSLWVSVVVGGLIALFALLLMRSFFIAILFGLLAYQSYQRVKVY
jgi:Zn-dependent protease